ncbi:chromatin protein Cren7 [Candidatus Bathyarchaeota archaeon]|nr:MAG: chromatin protein Cren7 [Candidatus Bathyarchaeota archaeon]
MARGGRGAGPKRCPGCGAEAAEPYKTWELVAPIPDKKGRITITIMGMYECPNCGKRFRAVVSKVKLGPDGVEVMG